MEGKFDKKNDCYLIGKSPAPRLSYILNAVFPLDVPQAVLIPAQRKGRIIHYITELYDNKDYPKAVEIAGQEDYIDYLTAWVNFRNEWGFTPLDIERICVSKKYHFGCRVDRVGLFHNEALGIVEIKSGAFSISHAVQTAAQKIAYDEGRKLKEKISKRLVVYLKEDGTFEVILCKKKSDRDVFLSCVTVFNYKRIAKKGG